jgi:rsbT co-antagonist protein RsbR
MDTSLSQLLTTADTLRLIDDLPLPLMIYRQDGLLVTMNQKAEEFWGIRRSQIVGRFNILQDPQSVEDGRGQLFAAALRGDAVIASPRLYDTGKTAAALALSPDEIVIRQLWIRTRVFPLHEGDGSISHVALANEDVTEEIGREQEMSQARREIEIQRSALDSLSSPVIQVWDGILTVPLVGSIDARRAMAITENLLEAIVAHQADIVILDITGVPVVDTSVASALMQAAQAVSLLGSRVVLVGVGAELAQTLVQLGVDLGKIITLANLKAGISWAFAQQGLTVSGQGEG